MNEAVNSYLSRNDAGVSDFFKCWQIAYDGMRELGLDFFFNVTTVRLPISKNLTATLPSNFLQWVKVGRFDEHGQITGIIGNRGVSSYRSLFPDVVDRQFGYVGGNGFDVDSIVFNNYNTDGGLTSLFGIGPIITGPSGKFKIDKGFIYLDNNYGLADLALEYVGSPDPSEDYMIPAVFKQSLMFYIRWQVQAFSDNMRKANVNSADYFKREFYRERKLAHARYEPLRLEELYQLNARAQRSTVKV